MRILQTIPLALRNSIDILHRRPGVPGVGQGGVGGEVELLTTLDRPPTRGGSAADPRWISRRAEVNQPLSLGEAARRFCRTWRGYAKLAGMRNGKRRNGYGTEVVA